MILIFGLYDASVNATVSYSGGLKVLTTNYLYWRYVSISNNSHSIHPH